MATTTIITKATYDVEYANKSSSSLIFPAEMFDCLGYVDVPKLRKKLKLKGRGKVFGILLRNDDDPQFVNIANKDIVYKNPVFISKNADGAFKYDMKKWGRDMDMWVTNHPIGNAIVVVKQ